MKNSKLKVKNSKFLKGFTTIMQADCGFTLIELLIVIAIIGILATLLMSNFIGVRQRARDGKRKSDISQMQAALEQYRADHGTYPPLNNTLTCNTALTDPNNVAIVYMKKIPCDPFVLTGQSYYNNGSYYYTSDGTSYTLAACLENASDPQKAPSSPGGGGCTNNTYYVVQNP